MSQTHLERARALRDTIDRNARAAGDAPIPQETVDVLAQAGLFDVMTPEALGGPELPLLDCIDVFAEVARADGSTGWCQMAGAITTAYFGAYSSEDFAAKMFEGGIPRSAGQFAPNGTAVRDGDGFRVNGRYQFGSGVLHSDWIGAGVLVMPEEGSDDPPQLMGTCVPRSEVEFLGNWDVLGLTSTASVDYVIDDVWVPEGAAFSILAPTVHRGGPLYALGIMPLTAAGHTGFAIGVVRRALDELMAIAKTKQRMGHATTLAESERFLVSLGTLESRFRSAVAWTREVFAAAERHVIEVGTPDPVLANQTRQATVFLTQEGADIVREAYLLAGTTALRDGPLARCFRDIHAGSQHFFASTASTIDLARDLLAAAPDDALDSNG